MHSLVAHEVLIVDTQDFTCGRDFRETIRMGQSMFDFESYRSNNTTAITNDIPTENSSSRTDASDNGSLAQKLGYDLVKIVMPIIIIAGTIGNSLSFSVLLRKRMRYTSIYFYLLFLACTDTMVLYASAFKTWIRVVTGFELLHLNAFSCKTTMFLLVVSQHMSAWLIVVVSLDRWVFQ